MLAAAVTLWLMFSLFLIAPIARLSPPIGRIAAILASAELIALLTWSFGVERCGEAQATCAPLAQAAGIAARTDIPALAATFIVVTLLHLRRRQRG